MSDDNVIQFSEHDKEQLDQLGISETELPQFHTILEVWREVLKPARDELHKKVAPGWANRIVTSFKEIRFADVNNFRDSYFGKLEELYQILLDEIATDDECLTYDTPELDVEHNSQHYKNLLTDWQKAFMQWELDWETTQPDAAVELAAISEVHRMFFGDTGLTAYLDNIKFEFTEHDQAALRDALEELKEAQ